MTTFPMTPTEMLPCPSDDLIAFAITEAFGERCPTTDADCYTCQAWSQYDKLRAAATPSAEGAEVSVEELEKFIHDNAYPTFDHWEDDFARALLEKYKMEKR